MKLIHPTQIKLTTSSYPDSAADFDNAFEAPSLDGYDLDDPDAPTIEDVLAAAEVVA